MSLHRHGWKNTSDLSACGEKASKGKRPATFGWVSAARKSLILVALTRKERLLIETGKQRGYTFSHPDVLIAASAAHHGLTVVTRNVREFVEAGVAVINPWADPGTNP
jgi:hypothetical protein